MDCESRNVDEEKGKSVGRQNVSEDSLEDNEENY
jgi:hypothetical protein